MSHRQPRGTGGAKRAKHDRLSNVNALCAKCHLGFVERYPAQAQEDGWKVRHGGNTSTVRFHAWFGWTTIDDAGAYVSDELPVGW
jgi:hypothetical protein